MATKIPWTVYLWRWLWLRKPAWFRVICWMKGHDWLHVGGEEYEGLNTHICIRCLDAERRES